MEVSCPQDVVPPSVRKSNASGWNAHASGDHGDCGRDRDRYDGCAGTEDLTGTVIDGMTTDGSGDTKGKDASRGARVTCKLTPRRRATVMTEMEDEVRSAQGTAW